jgi:hypothetical protein
MVGTDTPDGLDSGAHFPDRAGVEFGELGSKVAELGVYRIDVLAVATCRVWPAASTAASVVNGGIAWRTPRIELGKVVVGANAIASAVSVECAVEWIIVGRMGAALAAVDSIGICANTLPVNGSAIARFAADAAANGHPKACLADITDIGAVATGAWVATIRLPYGRRFSAMPLREIGVDRITCKCKCT